jgi:hypothetical protein
MPEQYTYFKTLKELKAALNRWGASWVRAWLNNNSIWKYLINKII